MKIVDNLNVGFCCLFYKCFKNKEKFVKVGLLLLKSFCFQMLTHSRASGLCLLFSVGKMNPWPCYGYKESRSSTELLVSKQGAAELRVS